jgi:hypothetical protein
MHVMRFARRLWSTVRHALAVRELLDLFGWKGTMSAAVVSALVVGWGWIKQLPGPILVVLGMVAFAVVLLVAFIIRRWNIPAGQRGVPPEGPTRPAESDEVPPVSVLKAAQSQPASSPAIPPKVVPVRYRESMQGLLITNDGEPAYDISIDPIKLGSRTVSFKGIERLSRGAKFWAKVEISDGESRVTLGDLGGALVKWMEATGDWQKTFTLCIRYRGFEDEHAFWTSVCELQRDVGTTDGGVSVRFLRQEPAEQQRA